MSLHNEPAQTRSSSDMTVTTIETDEIDGRSSITVRDTTNCFKFRYMMQILVFFAMFLVYAMRTNINITILAMVNTTDNSNGTEISYSKEEKYNWDEITKAWILNAFFWGYIFTQILGGYLAEKFSVKWVFGYGIFLTAVLTILSEAAVKLHYIAFIILRVLEGVCEGVTFPSLYALCARWSPITERSWMAGIGNVGTIIGTVVAIPLSAMLCKTSWGWPSVFYVFGLMGVVWGLVWYLLATSTPEKCRWISDEERDYIIQTRGVLNFEDKRGRKTPWKSLLTSRAVWMVALAKFTNSFSFYVFLTEIPNYLHHILKFEIQNNGWVNSAAYMSNAIVSIISSWSADRFISRNPANITIIRKLYECTAQLLNGITLILIPFCSTNSDYVVALLILNSTVQGLTGGGDIALPIDIGPSQSGAIQGFANTISNIAGVLAPLLVGYLTNIEESQESWNVVFVITAFISFGGAIIFGIWGTAEVQEWAKDDRDDERELVENE